MSWPIHSSQPGSARADHAHYQTASRARRRRPTLPAVGEPAADSRQAYVERSATMMVEGGLPRMASRVLAGVDLVGRDTPAGERLSQMAEFFERLSEDMSGGAGFQDCLAVLAAVWQADRLLSAEDLATSLGWPVERVTDVVEYAVKGSAQDGPEQPPGEDAVGQA